MPQNSYAYAVGRVRALENRLLNRDRIERMVDAPSAGEALKVLVESGYEMEKEISGPRDYERLLQFELEKTCRIVESITPDKELTNLLFLEFDMHNLKVLLKARLLGNDHDELLSRMGTIRTDVMKKAVSGKDYRELPQFLQDVLERIEAGLTLVTDPQKIDTMLDRAYYDRVFEVCRERRSSFLQCYFEKRVDLINIRSLLRVKKIGEGFEVFKKMMLPRGTLDEGYFSQAMEKTLDQLAQAAQYGEYGKVLAEGIQAFIKHGSLTVYERLMDNYLLGFLKSRRNNPLGIEAVIGYYAARENELKLVRMILTGKQNGIPGDIIRERLRDLYV